MDDDTAQLIAELTTRAAMVMEDVLESALTLGGAEPVERTRRLRELGHAAERISKLVAAALAIAEES